jgi:thiol-disulfide isomerase/thioredoxin
VGKALPQIDLETTDGGRFTTQKAKGKVTYLTFFASWCGSCKRELPELNDWVDKYAGQGFQVVAVGVDRVSEQSKKYVEQFGPKYAVALDPEAKTMGLFDINAMPTSFIVDKNGVVRHREVGFKQDEVFLIQKRIEGLLNAR